MAVALEFWNKTEVARFSCFSIEVDFFKVWNWKVVPLFWAILMFIEKLKLNYLYRETKLNDSKMSKSFLASLEKKKKMRNKIYKKLNAYALLLNRSELCGGGGGRIRRHSFATWGILARFGDRQFRLELVFCCSK